MKGEIILKRGFYFARNVENLEKRAFPEAQLPLFSTRNSICADFFCAEKVVVPSIVKQVVTALSENTNLTFEEAMKDKNLKPTKVHTGIKASMGDDEGLFTFNRSSLPKKGLVLANSVGVIDPDYFECAETDGEICFFYFNFSAEDVILNVGDKIGQGTFMKFYHPEEGLRIADVERQGGIGSTGL